MANTTLRSLTAISGTTLDNADLFLAHDYSANTEYKVSLNDLRTAIGNVGSGSLTVSSSGTTDTFIVTSTDSGAADAPDIVFFRDTASPAASDSLGNIRFRGKNSAGSNVEYFYIGSAIITATANNETSYLNIAGISNGVYSSKLIIRGDGGVGIGSSASATAALMINKPITGGTIAYGILINNTVNTDVTTAASALRTSLSTASSNTLYTITNLRHFDAQSVTLGANTIITNQFGFNSVGLTVANNNFQFYAGATTANSIIAGKTAYGFFSNNPTANGGGTTWNFYANGDAPNYMNGVLSVGNTSPYAAAKVQIDSTTKGFLPPRMTTTQRNAISSPPAGLMIYNSSTNKLNFYNGTAWEAVTSA